MKKLQDIFCIIALWTTSSQIIACPLCQTEIGQQVRQEIFNHTFFINLFYTVLPFLAFGVIALFTYFGLPSVFFVKSQDLLKEESSDGNAK